jgi:hypothetical protein
VSGCTQPIETGSPASGPDATLSAPNFDDSWNGDTALQNPDDDDTDTFVNVRE